jgi:hypothetical protein
VSFTVPSEDEDGSPWPIFRRVLKFDELDELAGMMEAGTTVAFMFRFGDWEQHGRGILGKCYCQPSAQGDLRRLFEQLLEDTLGFRPDFLIILNGTWWEEASPIEREVLVVHEARHARQKTDKFGAPMCSRETGVPVPAIRAHDLEEFNCVAERYGAWKGDIAEFRDALARHDLKVAQPSADRAEPTF